LRSEEVIILYISRVCRSKFHRSTCARAHVAVCPGSRDFASLFLSFSFLFAIVRASRTLTQIDGLPLRSSLVDLFFWEAQVYLDGRINSFVLSDVISWLGERRENRENIKLWYGDRDLSRSFRHVRLSTAEKGLTIWVNLEIFVAYPSCFLRNIWRTVTFVNMVPFVIIM